MSGLAAMLAISRAEVARLQEEVERLKAANAFLDGQNIVAEREIEELCNRSLCIYCNEMLTDSDADRDHWRTCQEHPARVELAECEAAINGLCDVIADMEAAAECLHEQLSACGGGELEKFRKFRNDVDRLTADRDACIQFITNEMHWCEFRGEMLRDSASVQNARKLAEFLDRFKAANAAEVA